MVTIGKSCFMRIGENEMLLSESKKPLQFEMLLSDIRSYLHLGTQDERGWFYLSYLNGHFFYSQKKDDVVYLQHQKSSDLKQIETGRNFSLYTKSNGGRKTISKVYLYVNTNISPTPIENYVLIIVLTILFLLLAMIYIDMLIKR